MICVIGGVKGGCGKSTIATNLAVIRSGELVRNATRETVTRDVLLVDADEQESSADFSDHRAERNGGEIGYTLIKLTGASVRTSVLKLKRKYDDIIIDTGGRDTTSQRAAISVADKLIVPFLPRSFDIWTLDKVTALVEEMRPASSARLKVVFLVNRADARGSDNEEALDILSERKVNGIIVCPAVLGNRKAFAMAAALGLAVTELSQSDGSERAAAEMTALYEFIFDIE